MFDPFSSYQFSKSQDDGEKYGIAGAFLEAAQQPDAAIEPFVPFDIRCGSTKRFIAWWVTLAHRLRMQGRRILVPLLQGDTLRDSTTEFMLYWAISTPPSAKRYRELVAPLRKLLLDNEAANRAQIRRLVLEVFWGDDVLKRVPQTRHASVLERSAAIRQQEIDCRVPGEGLPTKKFHVPENVGRDEVAAFCHFLAQVFQDEGMGGAEPYVYANRWHIDTPPIAAPFFAYALEQGGQTWRDKTAVRANIVHREKALQGELARRFDALTAYFCTLLTEDSNPDHLLWRMNSFWVDELFADYREAQQYLEAGGK
jgi:hypothetical protein